MSQAAIVAAINGTRAKNGKPPLHYNSRLETAARSQANLMASKDQLSHNLGVTLRQRVLAGHRDADLLGEVELTTNLIIAASESDEHLSADEIDRILGVDQED